MLAAPKSKTPQSLPIPAEALEGLAELTAEVEERERELLALQRERDRDDNEADARRTVLSEARGALNQRVFERRSGLPVTAEQVSEAEAAVRAAEAALDAVELHPEAARAAIQAARERLADALDKLRAVYSEASAPVRVEISARLRAAALEIRTAYFLNEITLDRALGEVTIRDQDGRDLITAAELPAEALAIVDALKPARALLARGSHALTRG